MTTTVRPVPWGTRTVRCPGIATTGQESCPGVVAFDLEGTDPFVSPQGGKDPSGPQPTKRYALGVCPVCGRDYVNWQSYDVGAPLSLVQGQL